MHFANPIFLYLLIFIPLYLWWQKKYQKKNKGIYVSVFDDLQSAAGYNSRWKAIFKYAQTVLAIVIISLFSITLARPQGGHEKEEQSKKGIDIIIAVDVSESMLAEDLQPNRMEVAKAALEKFINSLSDDRLGVVVFSGQAFTQSPLTFDYNILREYIKNITTTSINKNVRGLSGTAIGDAILSALNRFKKSEDRTKVLIVITDGDANTGADPAIAAKKASDENVKIYTVGVGKVGGAPLPTLDYMGRKTVARNQDGSVAMATFNEDALKNIAKIGGGQYFRASDNQSFDTVMAEINSLEKREVKMNMTIEYTENYFPVLLSLFIMFLVFLGFATQRSEIK